MSFQIMLDLLRAAVLGTQPDIPKDTDWDDVLLLSALHGVKAVIYPVVEALPNELKPSPDTMYLWTQATQIVRNASRRRHEALLRFYTDICRPLGWEITVLKGESLAVHYPDHLSRECGDNDILTSPCTYEEFKTELSRRSFALTDGGDFHESFTYEGVPFEGHNPLPQLGLRQRHVVFSMRTISSHPERRIPSAEEGIFYPDHIDEIVFQLSHLARHVRNDQSGIFRGLLDLYLLSRHTDLSDERLYRQLEEANLLEFASLIYSAVTEILAPLPGLKLQLDDKAGREFIERAIISFGQNSHTSLKRYAYIPMTRKEKVHAILMSEIREPIANVVKTLIFWNKWRHLVK